MRSSYNLSAASWASVFSLRGVGVWAVCATTEVRMEGSVTGLGTAEGFEGFWPEEAVAFGILVLIGFY